jgi:hypothetical protein
MATGIETCLNGFASVDLESVRDAPLLERYETKFVAERSAIDRILVACARAGYRILRARGSHAQAYTTTYFDTADFAFYRAHHAGRAARAKVRLRRYEATGDAFFEVKLRRNTGRTTKHRTVWLGSVAGCDRLPPEAQLFANAIAPVPVVETRFERITLINDGADERVTLDFGMSVRARDCSAEFADAVFIEVKQQRRRVPAFQHFLPPPRLRERSVSKYCLGVALMYPALKHNRFKPVLLHLRAFLTTAAPNQLEPAK